MNAIIDFLTQPAVEGGIHIAIAVIIVMEVVQHWVHHRRKKNGRAEKLYTLNEARAVLFDQVVADLLDRIEPNPNNVPHKVHPDTVNIVYQGSDVPQFKPGQDD